MFKVDSVVQIGACVPSLTSNDQRHNGSSSTSKTVELGSWSDLWANRPMREGGREERCRLLPRSDDARDRRESAIRLVNFRGAN